MKNDKQYIELVQQGNTAVFSKLVDKYQHYVFTIVYRILPNREEAEEAAQDVFLKAFRKIKDYRYESKFSTWLYPIARNTAIDYKRKKSHTTTSIDNDDSFLQIRDHQRGQLEVIQHGQQKTIIQELLQRLPEIDGQIVSLFYLKEQTIEEIGELLNLSATNVKVKLFRLRKRMKKEMTTLIKREELF